MSDVSDVLNSITGGFSLKDLAAGYVEINKAKLGAGLAYQNDYIDQLRGTVSLLRQQNNAQLYQQQQQQAQFNFASVVPWVLVAGAAFLVYKAVK